LLAVNWIKENLLKQPKQFSNHHTMRKKGLGAANQITSSNHAYHQTQHNMATEQKKKKRKKKEEL